MTFTREDESQTVRFQVRPPLGREAGRVPHRGDRGRRRAASSSAGIQVIEYPHIRRQHIYDEAATTLKVIDVKMAPNLTVGYVMGVGDEVPAAIEQLGVPVDDARRRGSGVG